MMRFKLDYGEALVKGEPTVNKALFEDMKGDWVRYKDIKKYEKKDVEYKEIMIEIDKKCKCHIDENIVIDRLKLYDIILKYLRGINGFA